MSDVMTSTKGMISIVTSNQFFFSKKQKSTFRAKIFEESAESSSIYE